MLWPCIQEQTLMSKSVHSIPCAKTVNLRCWFYLHEDRKASSPLQQLLIMPTSYMCPIAPHAYESDYRWTQAFLQLQLQFPNSLKRLEGTTCTLLTQQTARLSGLSGTSSMVHGIFRVTFISSSGIDVWDKAWQCQKVETSVLLLATC